MLFLVKGLCFSVLLTGLYRIDENLSSAESAGREKEGTQRRGGPEGAGRGILDRTNRINRILRILSIL